VLNSPLVQRGHDEASAIELLPPGTQQQLRQIVDWI